MAEYPRVLLVDDNPAVLEAMSMLMESIGWNVSKATSSAIALDLLTNRLHDLVILDLKMPDINGIELTRLIRSYFPEKPPVIFLHSGFIETRYKQEAQAVGIQLILNKPVGREEVIDALKKFNLPHSP